MEVSEACLQEEQTRPESSGVQSPPLESESSPQRQGPQIPGDVRKAPATTTPGFTGVDDARRNRYVWKKLPHTYHHCGMEEEGTSSGSSSSSSWNPIDHRHSNPMNSPKWKSQQEATCSVFTILTWNVMFDLTWNDVKEFDIGEDRSSVVVLPIDNTDRGIQTPTNRNGTRGDDDHDADSNSSSCNGTMERWSRLVDLLGQHAAANDGGLIIALQEVTPRFVQLLCQQEWVKAKFALSVNPKHPIEVTRSGNLLLWNRRRWNCRQAWICQDPFAPAGNIGSGGTFLKEAVASMKQRSCVVVLQDHLDTSRMLIVANLHLLADTRHRSAAQARQREIASIVGQVQTLEAQLLRNAGSTKVKNGNSKNNKKPTAKRAQGSSSSTEGRKEHDEESSPPLVVVPILLGDFNANEQQNELENGCFDTKKCFVDSSLRSYHGFFVDAAAQVASSSISNKNNKPPSTFDPHSNPKARLTRILTKSSNTWSGTDTAVLAPKRMDRIYVPATPAGRDSNQPWKEQTTSPLSRTLIQPQNLNLLGKGENPPSDHYGLSITFAYLSTPGDATKGTKSALYPMPTLSSPRDATRNAWAANSASTTDALLGLVLGQSDLGGIPLWDSQSTLPLPHITLLHGFVDLASSPQTRNLAVEACQRVVHQLNSQGLLADEERSVELMFQPSCLDVFVHANSATLVALPDYEEDRNGWLWSLYEMLVTTFRQCHHQESRFAKTGGWQPHVSLETLGTATAARGKATKHEQSGKWITKPTRIPVRALTLFQRDKTNGQIYAVASVPLIPKARRVSEFYADFGRGNTDHFLGPAHVVLMEIDRACRHTAMVLRCGTTRLVTTGSVAMRVCLPDISDVDAVVQIEALPSKVVSSDHDNRPDNSSSKGTKILFVGSHLFLQTLTTYIGIHHPDAKVRTRVAGTGTTTAPLTILTVRLWPTAPSVDLLVAFLEFSASSGHWRPRDSASRQAVYTIDDTRLLQERLSIDKTLYRVFQNVARVVKLWAWRNQIYGSSMGFLGGGGWLVWIATILLEGFESKRLVFSCDGTTSAERATENAIHYFFCEASKSPVPLIVKMQQTGRSCEDKATAAAAASAIRQAIAQQRVAILAPCSKGNHGRNTTQSTARVLLETLQQAALAAATPINLLQPKTLQKCLLEYGCYYTITATTTTLVAGGGARPVIAETKARGCAQMLHLLLALEQRLGSQQFRLCSHASRHQTAADVSNNNVKLTWFIGSRSDLDPQVLGHQVARWEEQMTSEISEASVELVLTETL